MSDGDFKPQTYWDLLEIARRKGEEVGRRVCVVMSRPDILQLDWDDVQWVDQKVVMVRPQYKGGKPYPTVTPDNSMLPAVKRMRACSLRGMWHEAGWMSLTETGLYTRSPGGNIHVYLRLMKPQSYVTRVAMQGLLDSDRRRETYNLAKGEGGCCLFETVEHYVRVMDWLGEEVPQQLVEEAIAVWQNDPTPLAKEMLRRWNPPGESARP